MPTRRGDLFTLFPDLPWVKSQRSPFRIQMIRFAIDARRRRVHQNRTDQDARVEAVRTQIAARRRR